jgi:hypothetical protein
MATNVRLAREQCEKAFANYFQWIAANPPAWAANPTPLTDPVAVNVFIRKGQFDADGQYHLESPDEIALPAVCVAVPQVKPHPGMEYPICELHVIIMNGVDEEAVNDRQLARLGFIAELLDESHKDELFARLNKPALAVDDRTVKNFNIFGFYQTEDMGREEGRHWIDHLVYECHCLPTDDVNGVS